MRPQRGASGGNRNRKGRRSVRRNRLLALAILAILALATVAPTGQASGPDSTERAAQHAVKAAERTAERETLRLQKEATRAARQEAKATNKAHRQAKAQAQEAIRLLAKEDEHAVVTIECTQIKVQYRNFPDFPGNTVTQRVVFKQRPGPTPTYVFPALTYSFNGPEATETIPIAAPLGSAGVGLRAHYDTHELKGGFNLHERTECGPNPGFTIETLQTLGGPFSSNPIAGAVGQTVAYETVATNTGNTPLTFGSFSDPGCDSTPAGVSSGTIAPRSSASFLCMHTLNKADATAGFYADAASLTGTPESGQGEPIVHTSSGVLVTPIEPGEEKSPEVITIHEVTSSSSPSSSSSSGSGGSSGAKGGVLSSSFAVPSLVGPARCVRSAFSAGVKATGVSNVTFYIDGRRLARRTAHSAVRGMIMIRINGTVLKAGLHHLLAKISMLPASPTSAGLTASRTRTVRRCRASIAGSTR